MSAPADHVLVFIIFMAKHYTRRGGGGEGIDQTTPHPGGEGGGGE